MSKIELKSPVLMGVIGGPHGIKGQCRVKSFTGDPEALADYGTLYAEDGRAFDIKDIRSAKNVVVVTFKQVSDRNTAEMLNGVELFVDRSQLPDDELEQDEFYIEDLVGMDVLDETGSRVGVVAGMHNYGADDMIEVASLNENEKVTSKTQMYPFTKAVVPTIDVENRTVTLVPPSEIIVAPEGSKERASDPDNTEDGS